MKNVENDDWGIKINYEYRLIENVKLLEQLSYQIKDLQASKAQVEREILELTGRAQFDDSGQVVEIEKEGQCQHAVGSTMIKIKTDYIYNVDKNAYEFYEPNFRAGFNPIRKLSKYDVDKKMFRDIYRYGISHDRDLLEQCIKVKPAKPSIILL